MPVCQHVFACLGVRLLCGSGVSVCERAYRECFSIPASSTSSLIGLQRHSGLAGRLTSWSSSDPTLSTPQPLWGAAVTWLTCSFTWLFVNQSSKSVWLSLLLLPALKAFISQLAPIKSLSAPPLLLHSVVECFGRSHSTLQKSKVLFSQLVSKHCWWNPTKQKQSRGEWRDGAAGLCRCGGSEGAMWWQGLGPDTPSKSGQILWSCLSSMNLACWHTHTLSLSLLSFQACSDSFSAFHSAVFQSQPSSEAVLIYRIPHKQAANKPASSGLRQHVYWKRKWIRTVRHGVFPIVLSAVFRLYVCESILILD